ncbi:MAG: radical SAM protein [Patescibacteria group bacterium]
MKRIPQNAVELKAKLLCEGLNVDPESDMLFEKQNPYKIKRGGLSSGGKMELDGGIFVNAPIYRMRTTDLRAVCTGGGRIAILQGGLLLSGARVLPAPAWYGKTAQGFPITQILTAHNRQLTGSVYEWCALFPRGDQCKFCVINRSLPNKNPRLIRKSPELIIAALEQIPTERYGGLTLNGGMTVTPGRGMEVMVPVVEAVSKRFPGLPIAIEITPPDDLGWIDRLADAGAASLMMNLECWDPAVRRATIPGKDGLCPRELYLRAFDRAVARLGSGRVSSCFVVGVEPAASLKQGLDEVVRRGVIPSPLAGRTFEDVPDYPFSAQADWIEFLDVLRYAANRMREQGIRSTDRAGCVACRMCDLIGDANANGLFINTACSSTQ